jgi:alpha 1,2-mannosyltransferase
MWHTATSNPIWKIVDSNDYNSYEQESGQIMINKEKCWKALNLCMYFNLQKDYYYQMLYGDKDTFKFAWVALRQHYYMIPKSLSFCGYDNEREKAFFGLTMIQHDMDGKMLFLHRNLHKWDITSPDETIWKEIRFFMRKEDEGKVFLTKYTDGNGRSFNAVNLNGETEKIGFKENLGNIEEECLEFLIEIRDNPLYGKFLFHMYNVVFRPAYLHQ